MKITFIELNLQCSMMIHQSVLISILDFLLSSEVATMQQSDSVAYKLKPRLFISEPTLQTFILSVNHTWHIVRVKDSGFYLFLFYFIIFISFLFIFLFLDLELGVNMMLYMIITNGHIEGHRRFWNNDVI